MNTDERKRGLRAAVNAKTVAHGDIGIWTYTVGLLWEIIDSLVDEIEQAHSGLCPHCKSGNVTDYGPKMHPQLACNHCGNMFDRHEAAVRPADNYSSSVPSWHGLADLTNKADKEN